MVKVKTRAGWSPATSTKPQPKKRRAEAKPVSAGGAYGEFVPSEQHGSFSATGNTLHILSASKPLMDGMTITGTGIPIGARLVFPTETTSKAEARPDPRIAHAMVNISDALVSAVSGVTQFATYALHHDAKGAQDKAEVNRSYAMAMESCVRSLLDAVSNLSAPDESRIFQTGEYNEDIRCE